MAYGQGLTTGVGCRLEDFAVNDDKHKRIVFGNNVQINDYVHISAIKKVDIGDNVLMASHVYISDNSHGQDKGVEGNTAPSVPPIKRPYFVAPVKIGNNAWLGEGVIVMPGVTIGDGCVIGALNKDILANIVAVGSPAKIVKKYNENLKVWEKV